MDALATEPLWKASWITHPTAHTSESDSFLKRLSFLCKSRWATRSRRQPTRMLNQAPSGGHRRIICDCSIEVRFGSLLKTLHGKEESMKKNCKVERDPAVLNVVKIVFEGFMDSEPTVTAKLPQTG